MADSKITALTANTSPVPTDIIPMVDDPSGTPLTQKITFSDALKVINGLTEDTSPDISSDYVMTYDTSASGVKKVLPRYLAAGDLENLLINGGFDFAQRQTPGTLTTLTDKKWGADRWQVFAENASWQYQRNDATSESGLTSKYYGTWKKITSTGKGIFCQKLEGVNSIPLRSKTVIFQIKMKASASKTIRMGILELQTGGTIDTFPAALASAFGANTVDPTWGTNVAIITAAQSKSVTTSWQSFSVSVTVPATSKNIVCAVWTDSQFAANDTLSMAEAGLFVSSTIQEWKPRLYSAEFELARRFYEKSYNVDTLPGTASVSAGNASNAAVLAQYVLGWSFLTSKRAAPTVTIWSYAGTAAKVALFDTAGDVGTTVTAVGIGENAVYYLSDSGSGFTVGKGYSWHWAAEAEIA